MIIFLFLLGVAQCIIIWGMGQAGHAMLKQAAAQKEAVRTEPPQGWPSCALIIPASGEDPNMEKALRSLLSQNYPDFTPYIAVADTADPAWALAEKMREDFPSLTLVTAGMARNCGQKNHNLLAGIAAAGNGVDVYVCCDSTHVAQPDFLRCLLLPIARHESAFATGYHQVVPGDVGTATLAYTLTVLSMRIMQAMAFLTQPWGGALAMKRTAYEHYRVAELWEHNVVDDCSLAELLRKSGVHIRHCPGAILDTFASGHKSSVWNAWLERQLLFLKFCMPGQWAGLGLFCALMAIPPLWCAMALFWGLLGLGGGLPPFLALLWLCLAAWAICTWRGFVRVSIPPSRWVWAFMVSCTMFGLAYVRSLSAGSITWRDLVYKLGRGGEVLEILRRGKTGDRDETRQN